MVVEVVVEKDHQSEVRLPRFLQDFGGAEGLHFLVAKIFSIDFGGFDDNECDQHDDWQRLSHHHHQMKANQPVFEILGTIFEVFSKKCSDQLENLRFWNRCEEVEREQALVHRANEDYQILK